MDNGFLAIALLALSAALIIAEVFIPSAGMLAIGMLISLVASFYFAWTAWWATQPTLFFGFVGFAIVMLPVVTVGAISWLPKTRFGKRILLEAPDGPVEEAFAREEEQLRNLIGRRVKAITPLSPGGLISVDRERIHAYSQGVVIERGATVEIVKVSGNRVVVREVLEEEQSVPAPSLENDSNTDDSNGDDDDTNPLDLDLREAEN
ncbi:NfeD family protein [Rubinisphaera sp. JC750]|uniref:NfeD family protein n=1 Tax=Rubinisphaera sp. JC750 TaxID=2898658 RepID=UPI001F48FA1A|nr:NfeD family protein [Rubinisphaera sp. JC750]